MLLPWLYFAIAALGFLLAMVVRQADPRRWDNRVLSAVGFIDGFSMLAQGLAGFEHGSGLTGVSWHVAMASRVLIAYPTLVFVYSFPFNRRPKRWANIAGGITTALGLVIAFTTVELLESAAPFLFFLPYFCVTLWMLIKKVRNIHETDDPKGALWVVGAVMMRWGLELVSYAIVLPLFPSAFPGFMTFNAMVVVLASYVVIAVAMLRHQFFRMRGILAEMALHALAGGVCIALFWAMIDLVLRLHLDSMPERIALVFACVGAAVLFRGVASMQSHIELLLLPLDPRRAARVGTLERVISQTASCETPHELWELTRRGLADLAGGEVCFVRGPAYPLPEPDTQAVPAALAEYFSTCPEAHLHRRQGDLLPAPVREALLESRAEVFFPARVGGRVYGALTIARGELDRATVETAKALAENLATKLDNFSLFSRTFALQSALEGARRLAALGTFAAAIAHDIRTPITSVQLNVQMLRARIPADPDTAECCDIALDELRRLNSKVSQILDFAKPAQPTRREIAVCDVARDAAKRLSPILSQRNLELRLALPPDIPAVHGDAEQIRQVVVNLLENAAGASADGDVIELSVYASDDGRVAIEVKDHGCGIDVALLARVFEPFFTTRSDGTGLGLAIVQKLVRAHGGDVKVKSRRDAGATFTVLLPA